MGYKPTAVFGIPGEARGSMSRSVSLTRRGFAEEPLQASQDSELFGGPVPRPDGTRAALGRPTSDGTTGDLTGPRSLGQKGLDEASGGK